MTPDQFLQAHNEARRKEEEIEQEIIKAMEEHDAEVAACGGHREYLHQRCGMSYEQIDAFNAMVKKIAEEALAQFRG